MKEIGSFLKGEYVSDISACRQWYMDMDMSPEKSFSDHVCDMDTLYKALQNGFPPNRVYRSIAATGNLELLIHIFTSVWVKKSQYEIPFDTESCANAAKGGHFECLRWLEEVGCPWDESTCSNAAKGGHLKCLEYAHENECPWDEDTCERAAEGGHMKCLEFALENGCSGESIVYGAALGGHLEIVKWATSKGYPSTSIYDGAAQGGYLDILKWAHENSIPFTGSPKFYSAFHGNYECLKWTLKNVVNNTGLMSDIFEPQTGIAAVQGGNIECVRLALDNGFSLLESEVCAIAARNGNLEMLKFLRGNGCPFSEETCADAAEGGHLELLRWARENGCPWDEKTCTGAARGGHLFLLKWVRQNGCPWDEKTCAGAAGGGYLKILSYLKSNGCPMDRKTHENAAGAGYLNIAKWVSKNGPLSGRAIHGAIKGGHVECVEWEIRNISVTNEEKKGHPAKRSSVCCAIAAEGGYLRILKLLHSHGFEMDEDTCFNAANGGHRDCLIWALENDCEIDQDNIDMF